MTPLTIHPETTALVLIDLQYGIVERDLAPHTGQDVVRRCKQLADALRERGGVVVFVRVALDETRNVMADAPTRDPNAPPPPARASELVGELGVRLEDVRVTKRQWGAFYGTDLDQHLRRRGIRTIVLGGIATNFGVESTARAAMDQGYDLVLVEDAMASFTAVAHAFAVQTIFPRMGYVRSTEEVLQALLPSGS